MRVTDLVNPSKIYLFNYSGAFKIQIPLRFYTVF
jgi:hypothetical protein